MHKHTPSKVAVLALLAFSQFSFAKPLKIYLMVGQSNMQGMAMSSTLPYMAEDAATRPLLNKILDDEGAPKIYKDVYVAAFSGRSLEGLVRKQGPLTIGYGRALGETEVFGPELGFGITMHETQKEPILIIKAAWGGLSLHTNFRPPSAGPYELPDATLKQWAKHPDGAHGVPSEKERAEWWKKKRSETGQFYKLMIQCIHEVIEDPAKVYPEYDEQEGYELAGLIWFQGWNDAVDRTTYPQQQEDRFKSYSDQLGHFIRDVRKELNAPKMPVVIGVMGVGGNKPDSKPNDFRLAMAAPAELPEFKGNVFAVSTAEFWEPEVENLDVLTGKYKKQAQQEWKEKNKDLDVKALPKEENISHLIAGRKFVASRTQELVIQEITEERYNLLSSAKSNAGYHYLGCGKTMARIGEAFAKPLLMKR